MEYIKFPFFVPVKEKLMIDIYSKFFEELLQRLGAVQYENTYRAISDYFETHTLSKPKDLDEDKDDLTDVKGIARYTGYSIYSIYKFVTDKRIPYLRYENGRRLFFSKKEVLAWIKNNRSATRDEIATEARSIKIKSKNK